MINKTTRTQDEAGKNKNNTEQSIFAIMNYILAYVR